MKFLDLQKPIPKIEAGNLRKTDCLKINNIGRTMRVPILNR